MSAQKKHLRANDKQILIEFYKIQWNIIHDLNNLDWRIALIFIPLIGAFSAVVGILSQWIPDEITYFTQAIQAFGLVVFLFCLYGLWTVAKGQAHSTLKFETLKAVEQDLCLHGYIHERHPKWRRFWPVIACRRIFLFAIYFVLGVLTLSMVIIPLNEWSLSAFWQSCIWEKALAVTIGILIIQYVDYKIHLRETC